MFSDVPTDIPIEKKDLRTNNTYSNDFFPTPIQNKKKTPPKDANKIKDNMENKRCKNDLDELYRKRDVRIEEEKKKTKNTSWFSSLFSRGGREEPKRRNIIVEKQKGLIVNNFSGFNINLQIRKIWIKTKNEKK
jgi:hypothetical protein